MGRREGHTGNYSLGLSASDVSGRCRVLFFVGGTPRAVGWRASDVGSSKVSLLAAGGKGVRWQASRSQTEGMHNLPPMAVAARNKLMWSSGGGVSEP